MPLLFVKYAAVPELGVFAEIGTSGLKKQVNTVLLGTWLGVTEESGNYYKVTTAGDDGWVKKSETTDLLHLKVFYIDVGQGDACLLEIDKIRFLVDGGPNSNFRNYLTKWQYKYLLDANQKIHIDFAFVSHFDADHYDGLTAIVADERFTFGKIYHTGIAVFHSQKSPRPAGFDEDLGKTFKIGSKKYLETTFNSLADCRNLLAQGGLGMGFQDFLEAVVGAADAGRLAETKSLSSADKNLFSQNLNGQNFALEILGPVKSKADGKDCFAWFKDSSVTRNGHSIVLKLSYGSISLLFGGDLNSDSETHLIKNYGATNPFLVDVAKSCHHGSSDFTEAFMEKISPFATVISSGDNESYSHPRADAIGCAGKYTRGPRPKVFSTELARSINKSGDILFGMINLRSDGQIIHMAQMKEKRSAGSVWDAYSVK